MGIHYHRNRLNDDYAFRTFAPNIVPHDVEHSVNLNYGKFMEKWFLDFNLNVTARRNWYYDTNVSTFFNIQPSIRVTYYN